MQNDSSLSPTADTPAQAVPTPAPARRSWQLPALIGGGVVVLLLALVIGLFLYNGSTRAASGTVSAYYNAVKQQDYTKAYSYTSLNGATDQGADGMRRFYSFIAKSIDDSKGKVVEYSQQGSNVQGDNATVEVQVKRKDAPYTVRLTLHKTGDIWKITNYSNI